MATKPPRFVSHLKFVRFIPVEIPGHDPLQAFQYFGSDWKYAFRSGDYLVIRLIESITDFDFGAIYVLGMANNVLVKRIYKITSEQKFLCSSDNDDKDSDGKHLYVMIEVPTSMVLEMGKVVAVIRLVSI